MQLAAHELHDLHELTLSCVNSITHMAYFLEHVQCSELKALLEKHFPLHVRDYNMKVEFLNEAQGPQRELKMMKIDPKLPSFTKSPAGQYPPITPRTEVPEMNDREMATGYLLNLKRAGREYAYSAMEAANPDLRGFLETAFLMSSSHAYDVWQYMVNKGFYPLEPAPQPSIQTIGQIYRLASEETPSTAKATNPH
ncbi:spore coat protein [Paludifilum halophilum]|uniref:Spore coat protein n=1 Tax=Paludifilum halophilum TaxID=1642702 RepID=A0A235B3R6_9BACL|nr:spore coat protein [Paludifilum halophilum]OYD06275.1 spore coat protein [Paludifilum halophilum]